MYDTVFIAGSVDEEPQSLEKVIGHLHPPCPWGPLRPLSFLGTMWWVPGDRISCSGDKTGCWGCYQVWWRSSGIAVAHSSLLLEQTYPLPPDS